MIYPIKFPEANKILTKSSGITDKECKPLWVYSDGEQCISCWKLGWKERIFALIFGNIWLSVLGGQTQPPVWIDSRKTVFEKED